MLRLSKLLGLAKRGQDTFSSPSPLLLFITLFIFSITIMTLDEILQSVEDFITPSSKREVVESLPSPEPVILGDSDRVPFLYIKDESYVKENKAPEKNITPRDLKLVATEFQNAVKEGAIPASFAPYLLPMLMTEGHPSNFGVRQDDAAQEYANARNRALYEKLGLKTRTGKEGNADIVIADYIDKKGKNRGPHLLLDDSPDDAAVRNAKLMMAKLATRVAKHGEDPEKVIKGYNGKGKALEDVGYGQKVPADVKVHWDRIQQQKAILEHVANTSMREYFKSLLSNGK